MNRMLVVIFTIMFLFMNSVSADVRIAEQDIIKSWGYLSIPDLVSWIADDSSKRFVLLAMPVDGRISSMYGWRVDPIDGIERFHSGVDFANICGASIRSSDDGIVAFVGWMRGCGRTVEIDHGGGLVTRYCHLSRFATNINKRVSCGETIGLMGESGRVTGSHLHFEVRLAGGPVDPATYLVY